MCALPDAGFRRACDLEYTAEKITRSIYRQKVESPLLNPEIPFHLSFEFSSSNLAPGAKAQLSRARAEAAKNYLVSAWGISPSSVTATGLGESDPATPGTSEAARADNRRVVLEVVLEP